MPPLSADDNKWFEENLYLHEPILRSWLGCRFPGLKNEVEDLVQEAFVKVLKVCKERELECPKTFLFATARNLAVDQLRRKKVVEFIPLVEFDNSFVSENEGEVSRMLTQSQEREMLKEAIAALPNRCREVITLRKVEGLSHKEIAQRLGISSNTIQNQISVGVRKIRDHFRDYIKERGHCE